MKRIPLRTLAILVGTAITAIGLLMIPLLRKPPVEVLVILRDRSIEAAPPSVQAGSRIKLIIRNEGTKLHEVEVEGYQVEAEDIRPGEVRTLSFKAKYPGNYLLVCRIPGHPEAGMQTVLRITE